MIFYDFLFPSSYIGSIIILGLQSHLGTFSTDEIFAPLVTGAAFHLVWFLVKGIFDDFMIGRRWWCLYQILIFPFCLTFL